MVVCTRERRTPHCHNISGLHHSDTHTTHTLVSLKDSERLNGRTTDAGALRVATTASDFRCILVWNVHAWQGRVVWDAA